MTAVSAQEKDFFLENGYLLKKQFFTKEEITRLRQDLARSSPRYPTILDRDGLIFREHLLFESPGLQIFACLPKVVALVKEFFAAGFWVRKDQEVAKRPGGNAFGWHQDNGYNRIQEAYLQFWIPLTPMNEVNGGLWVAPGSHQHGVRPHRMLGTHAVSMETPEQPVLVSAKPGDALLFSSMLLHYTGPNRSQEDRTAYILELMSLKHFDPFAKPPFFVVAKKGVPVGRFVSWYPGYRDPTHRLKYLPLMAKVSYDRLLGTLVNSIKKRIL